MERSRWTRVGRVAYRSVDRRQRGGGSGEIPASLLYLLAAVSADAFIHVSQYLVDNKSITVCMYMAGASALPRSSPT